MQEGDAGGAEACFRNAVRLAPDFAEAHANLGLLLDKRGAAAAAEASYRRSIELDPAYPQTHLNLGALLAGAKRFDAAEAAYRQAIARKPDSPVAWSNLGVLQACMKRESEAEQSYRTAMALDESYANARFNLSYLLLRQGRFEEGWQCLEARDWYAVLAAHFDFPRWQGEPLAGKSLLIGYEAGHGDMLQFCRYASPLKAQGASGKHPLSARRSHPRRAMGSARSTDRTARRPGVERQPQIRKRRRPLPPLAQRARPVGQHSRRDLRQPAKRRRRRRGRAPTRRTAPR